MNNKELTELKERFMSAYCEPNKLHHKWGDKLVDGEYYQYSPDDVWAWIELTVLPHLKSNDEIKREAVEESMLLRLSSRVHAMFRDAIDPKSVSGYNEALDDVQDMIQEYLTQKENNE